MKSITEFLQLDNYTEEHLQFLIDNEYEESKHLDYKRGDALIKSDAKKQRGLCKHVSAFANSTGGLLIYGIEEIDHKPKRIFPLDGNEITKEWIEHVINSGIKKKIKNIVIYPIRIGGEISQSVYIIKIPKSDDAPHRLETKPIYYKRDNFQSSPMNEDEIKETYLNTRQSILDIKLPRISKNPNRPNKDIPNEIEAGSFPVFIVIANIGKVMEKDYKADIIIPTEIMAKRDTFAYYDENDLSQKVKFRNQMGVTLSVLRNTPIFPDETYPLGFFRITITNPISQADLIITVKLYYGDNFQKRRFLVKDIFAKRFRPV